MAKSPNTSAPGPVQPAEITTNAQRPLTQTSTPASINAFTPSGPPTELGQQMLNAQPKSSGPVQVSTPAAPAPWSGGVAPDGFNYGAILAKGAPAGYIAGPIVTDKNTVMTPELQATLDYNKALRYQQSANRFNEAAANYGTTDMYATPAGYIPRDKSLIREPAPDPRGFVVGGSATSSAPRTAPTAFTAGTPALQAFQNSPWGNAVVAGGNNNRQYQALADALAAAAVPRSTGTPQIDNLRTYDFSVLTPQQRQMALAEYVRKIQPTRAG